MQGQALLVICIKAQEELMQEASIPHLQRDRALLSISSRFKFTYIKWKQQANLKTAKLKICVPMWPAVAELRQQQNGTRCHFFWNKRKNIDSSTLIYIRLYSSSDSSTHVYTRLVTRLCFQNRSDMLSNCMRVYITTVRYIFPTIRIVGRIVQMYNDLKVK